MAVDRDHPFYRIRVLEGGSAGGRTFVRMQGWFGAVAQWWFTGRCHGIWCVVESET